MIRSLACQPWQPDLPGHAGDRGDLLSYTTPWDTIELVRIGLALDWPKFSGGKYRHLEPEDARRKLWRAAARQRGMLRMPD